MPPKPPHSKKKIISIQKLLLDEEARRLKEQGVKIKARTFNNDGSPKLSQAITTLLSPYNDMSSNYQGYSALVAITCMAWNASLVAEPERGEMVKQVVSFFKDKTDAKGLL